MTTVRYDVLSGSFCVIAQERSKRPSDFPGAQKHQELGRARVENCPFCPGNEKMTPPEVAAFREGGERDGPGWSVRVVPNKYPAFVPVEESGEEEEDAFKHCLKEMPEVVGSPDASMYWELPGIGAHEVIIDSPAHNGTLGTYSRATAGLIIRMLRDRHRALSAKPEIAYVHLFRNWGPEGGASLSHPHFQGIGLPFVPGSVLEEETRFQEYSKKTGRCLLCDIAEREMEKDERVVLKGDAFRVIAPFASRFSYETLIIPRGHKGSFGRISDDECDALAASLTALFARYERLFPSLSYNMVWHSLPDGKHQVPEYHWHIHVFPRLTTMAGLELGTGVFINPTAPEVAAGLLGERADREGETGSGQGVMGG
ncbi:MAG TPA: galactose-1-phosphate uridylyltransferase [Firmicutes bacterium]|nr:galactose-1-phosphate uridylyltransferase [Candidatus Fermentithermobacillaceae bacterium]